ncbi:N4-gp56 family major capsid protein [Bacillus sp. FJAT-49732]|uniref:N4-gp56 family major capsid protein n=1 Tax=Lederbergia citrisecunda TaxID=2833583 RepID=A0A942YL51_9BACI|nr:N4-gp56 family major capsid protein [Lederbergia citrisecunda]MBS4200282.1 N4-gp56 family major capsid protein [Lederbergia citrisecunda]
MANVTNTLRNNASGYNALSAEQAEFYQRTMLERLLPELVMMKYGEKKNIPKRAGDVTSFRRLNPLAVSTTAITEGVTPENVSLDITKLTATVKQYGNWVEGTDWVDMTALDPIITETTELLGENAGESTDIIVRDIVAAGTNVFYAGAKTTRDQVGAADKITRADVLKIRRSMKRNKVRPIKLPDGSSGYLAFIHTDVATDLMKDPEWVSQNTYVNTKNRVDGMIGKMDGIYFLEYDHAPKFVGAGATGADVYATIIIGKGAYGVPDIEGSSKPDIIAKGLGENGNDPMNQRWTLAWKSAFTALRLNELCIVRYESGATQ